MEKMHFKYTREMKRETKTKKRKKKLLWKICLKCGIDLCYSKLEISVQLLDLICQLFSSSLA